MREGERRGREQRVVQNTLIRSKHFKQKPSAITSAAFRLFTGIQQHVHFFYIIASTSNDLINMTHAILPQTVANINAPFKHGVAGEKNEVMHHAIYKKINKSLFLPQSQVRALADGARVRA